MKKGKGMSSLAKAAGDECEMTPEELQRLIEERTRERKCIAEERRLEGLRRIAEMKATSGIHPLERFPKEIWIMILKGVTPRDKANMCQVHPAFQDLLEDDKIRDILLPLVMDYNISLLERLLRNTHDEINMEQVKVLRLVSKEARISVDKWIEDDILNSMRNVSPLPVRLNPNILFTAGAARLNLNAPTPTQHLTRSLQVVIFGSVEPPQALDHDNDAEQAFRRRFQNALNNFCDHIAEVLKKVGDKILYFDLSFCGISSQDTFGLNIAKMCHILRQCLLLMPYLKWMQLKAVDLHGHALIQNPNWLRQANAALQAHPVPRMNELERADFCEWKGFPLWNAVLAANPHVKFHKLCGYGIHANDEYERYAEPSVLSLSLKAVNGGLGGIWDLPMLQQISNSNWKLKTLIFGIHAPVEVNAVLQYLGKFPTLEILLVRMHDVTIGKRINFLRLPNLKTFIFNLGPEMKVDWAGNFQFFFSLQFLLYCSKLQSLKWDVMLNTTLNARCKMNKMRLDGIISFNGGLGDLTECNVWDVFPLLRSLEVIFWDKDGDNCKRKYSEGKLIGESNPRQWAGLKSFL